MAALATTDVSLYPATQAGASRPSEWFPRGLDNRGVITRQVKLTSVSVGGATNTIGASALGLSVILECSSFFDSTNSKIIPAAVDPVNNVVLLGAGSSLAVGDLSTVTGYMIVSGTVKSPSAT